MTTRRTATRLLLSGLLPALLLPALDGSAARAAPALLKLAVFEFELDDFTAGGPIAGESTAETERLHRITEQTRKTLAESGLFQIVDVAPSTVESVRTRWLRNCNGCDSDAARDLGADYSLVGLVRKVSVMEQYMEIRMRDAHTGELVKVAQTDFRNETDESWRRAVAFLLRYRVIEPMQAAAKASQ
jgi:Protein of unknown function (DUF2380)